MVSTWFRVKPGEGERKALISAGVGAGLAAAFNAPLAGAVFVLEELHGAFTPVIFVAAFLASVTADVVCRVLTGETPVFQAEKMLFALLTPDRRRHPVAQGPGRIVDRGDGCGLGSERHSDSVRTGNVRSISF